MSLIASAKSTYELLQPGSYPAVCVSLVDIGTMTGPFGTQQKLWLEWEVDEGNVNGQRRTIGKLYTNSISNKAKLREHLEAWRGKPFARDELDGFDMTDILGKSCLLAISNNTKGDKTYANVDSVARLAKGMTALEPGRELLTYDTSKPDPAVLEKLPEWIVQKIEEAPEFAPPAEIVSQVDPLDGDVPF
jgi:hypothetical protein